MALVWLRMIWRRGHGWEQLRQRVQHGSSPSLNDLVGKGQKTARQHIPLRPCALAPFPSKAQTNTHPHSLKHSHTHTQREKQGERGESIMWRGQGWLRHLRHHAAWAGTGTGGTFSRRQGRCELCMCMKAALALYRVLVGDKVHQARFGAAILRPLIHTQRYHNRARIFDAVREGRGQRGAVVGVGEKE